MRCNAGGRRDHEDDQHDVIGSPYRYTGFQPSVTFIMEIKGSGNPNPFSVEDFDNRNPFGGIFELFDPTYPPQWSFKNYAVFTKSYLDMIFQT